jgi:hypothetical protein
LARTEADPWPAVIAIEGAKARGVEAPVDADHLLSLGR